MATPVEEQPASRGSGASRLAAVSTWLSGRLPGWLRITPRTREAWVALGLAVGLSIAVRCLGFIAMMALALYAEGRPAPHLPDLIIDHLPYVETAARYNHYLLALSYIPLSLALLATEPRRFCRYNVTAGCLSLLRGVSIVVTGLGPVHGADVHAGMFDGPGGGERYLAALWELCTPGGLLVRGGGLYLGKDLYFSGHTSATFLLLLYVWPHRPLRSYALVGHVLVVASVFASHLHYTIDVIGAYAVALSIYALREGWPPRPTAGSPSA